MSGDRVLEMMAVEKIIARLDESKATVGLKYWDSPLDCRPEPAVFAGEGPLVLCPDERSGRCLTASCRMNLTAAKT
jgi:hypothetical protein